MFACRGIAMCSVSDGGSLLERLRQAAVAGPPFDLLLFDPRIAAPNDLAFLEVLAKEGLAPPATILTVTAEDLPATAARCRELGFGECLVKPVDPSSLNDLLTAHFTSSPPPDPDRAVRGAPGDHGGRLLLVEDNEINRRLAIALLEKQGWEVTAVGDGTAALERLAEGGYELVLMDVQMPGMDGMEATRAIRSGAVPGSRQVPIVGLSAHALKEDRERCLAAGMNDYLTKPIDPETLHRVVAEYQPRPRALDIDQGLRAVEDDRRFLAELAGKFLAEIPERLVAFRAAVEGEDAAELERQAHSLKSVAGVFGGGRTVDLARCLEMLAAERRLSEARPLLDELAGEIEQIRIELQQIVSREACHDP
jgi:CheY-like chemotaxis protein